jgi:glycosyltransferase involved in cell wall biosynthesis
MRVLLNGMSMLGRLTGVGQYAWRLAEALADSPRIESVDIFQGRRIVPWTSFHVAAQATDRVDRYERLKNWVRGNAPFCRDLVSRFRAASFARETRSAIWDVYHEPNYIPQRFAGATVTTVCDMSYLRCPEYLPSDRLHWLRKRLETSVRNSEAVIAISEFTRNELLELFPGLSPRRVHVTPLGVDLERFNTAISEERLERVRTRHRLPEQFVLYLGTLEPRKNLQGLVHAFQQLPMRLQREYPLVLAGMGGWKQHYFRPALDQLRRQGLVHELGYVGADELPSLLRAATAFCFPSIYEGFGLPPLEAAAVGTPVIASNTSSLPEVLGSAAVYVDPKRTESIAEGLRRVLESEPLQATLRAAGPRRAQQFTWKRCAERTLEAYEAAGGLNSLPRPSRTEPRRALQPAA